MTLENFYILLIKIIHKIKIIFLDYIFVFSSKRQILLFKKMKESVLLLPALEIENTTNQAWTNYRINVREKMINKNPSNFLNWDIVRNSMFHECSKDEHLYLKGLKDYGVWKKATIESKVGNPRPYPFFLRSSGNVIHNAYCLSRLVSKFDIDTKSLNNIFEFGGGYGSMCRLFLNVGFKGQYIIYDLPEFNYLQEYFLKSVFLNKSVVVFGRDEVKNNEDILLVSNKDDLMGIFENHKIKSDIFLATWSISEAPVEIRDMVFEKVKNPCYYLIAYRYSFEGVDNKLYFDNFCKKNNNYVWNSQEIVHLPGNYFLIGKRIDE